MRSKIRRTNRRRTNRRRTNRRRTNRRSRRSNVRRSRRVSRRNTRRRVSRRKQLGGSNYFTYVGTEPFPDKTKNIWINYTTGEPSSLEERSSSFLAKPINPGEIVKLTIEIPHFQKQVITEIERGDFENSDTQKFPLTGEDSVTGGVNVLVFESNKWQPF